MRKGHEPSASVVGVGSGGACGIGKACPPAGLVIAKVKGVYPHGCYLNEPAPGVVGVGDVKGHGAVVRGSHLRPSARGAVGIIYYNAARVRNLRHPAGSVIGEVIGYVGVVGMCEPAAEVIGEVGRRAVRVGLRDETTEGVVGVGDGVAVAVGTRDDRENNRSYVSLLPYFLFFPCCS